MKRLRPAAILGLMILAVPQARAGLVFNAVADFSLASNPNGPWSYLSDDGSGPQLLTEAVINFATDGADAWFNGLAGPNAVATIRNVTDNPISIPVSTVQPVPLPAFTVLPPNLLGMDPESAKSDITRWTAPSAGTWSISGLFQSIVTTDLSHTVEILENSSTVLLAPTVVSPLNQTVDFGASVSLAKGDTIDFIVDGMPVFADFSTGLSATIELTSVPEPSTMILAIVGSFMLGGAACFRRTCRP